VGGFGEGGRAVLSHRGVVEDALLCSASEVRLSFAEPFPPHTVSAGLARKQGATLALAHRYDYGVAFTGRRSTPQPPTAMNLTIAAVAHLSVRLL
jgi:hypothetical protein